MIFAGTPGDAPSWQCLPFESLDTRTLYDLLSLRTSVFVVEQQCAYQELDGKDLQAWHVIGHRAGRLVATARILAPGISYDGAASIGRVVADPQCRGQRLGEALMRQSLNQCHTLFPEHPVRIGAQAHLAGFYGRLGFQPGGEPYLEDGIAHIEMARKPGPLEG